MSKDRPDDWDMVPRLPAYGPFPKRPPKHDTPRCRVTPMEYPVDLILEAGRQRSAPEGLSRFRWYWVSRECARVDIPTPLEAWGSVVTIGPDHQLGTGRFGYWEEGGIAVVFYGRPHAVGPVRVPEIEILLREVGGR